jgi:hypothetical protein
MTDLGGVVLDERRCCQVWQEEVAETLLLSSQLQLSGLFSAHLLRAGVPSRSNTATGQQLRRLYVALSLSASFSTLSPQLLAHSLPPLTLPPSALLSRPLVSTWNVSICSLASNSTSTPPSPSPTRSPTPRSRSFSSSAKTSNAPSLTSA